MIPIRTHFYLPIFCLPDSFNFHLICSQTSLTTNSEMSHKQWTRMLLVVSTTFCVLHWYDHSWLTGCKTSSSYRILSCLFIPTGRLKSTFWHAAYGYDVWKMFVFLFVWINNTNKQPKVWLWTCLGWQPQERTVRTTYFIQCLFSPTLERDKGTSNSNIHKEWMGKPECPGEKPISQTQLMPNKMDQKVKT